MILIRAKTLKRGQKSGEVGEVWGGLGNLPDVFGEVANRKKCSPRTFSCLTIHTKKSSLFFKANLPAFFGMHKKKKFISCFWRVEFKLKIASLCKIHLGGNRTSRITVN